MAKWEKIGEVHRRKKFNWDAFWGWVFVGIIALTIISNL